MMNENDLRCRISDVFKHYGTTPGKMAGKDAALQNRLSRQMRGASITYDTIITILENYPDVSSDWLLRGRGEMLLADNLPAMSGKEDEEKLSLHAEVARLTSENEELRRRCIMLEGQKELLREMMGSARQALDATFKKNIS